MRVGSSRCLGRYTLQVAYQVRVGSSRCLGRWNSTGVIQLQCVREGLES